MKDFNFYLGGGTNEPPVSVALSKAPHILVAGMTGAGKSVLIHDLLCQVIDTQAPQDFAFVLIDPKRVEFSRYVGVPHLAIDPVYNENAIENILRWSAAEMHNRFSVMERNGWRDASQVKEPWPRLVVVVDELANLMLRGKRFSKPLVEIASMGRAAGVHLILATQRPDAKVIDGLIRANVPTRVALPTVTAMDSRIILDEVGAESISIPRRLIRLPGQRALIEVSGRFWTDANIDRSVNRWLHARA